MEVTIKELTEVSREVEITADAIELAPHFEKAYKDYRPKIEIRGFRKGKAPLDLVKKLYGEMIENESLETVAGELYRQVAKEKELNPIGEPRPTLRKLTSASACRMNAVTMVCSRPMWSDTQPQKIRPVPFAMRFIVSARVTIALLIPSVSPTELTCAVTISPPTPIINMIA